MPGMVSGMMMRDKGLQLTGAKISRRFQQRAVELLDAGVERHHHKRQQNIDQADNYRRGVYMMRSGVSMTPATAKIR